MCLEAPPQLNWEKVWEHRRSVAGSAFGSKSHVPFAGGSARKRRPRRGPGSGASSVGSKSRVSMEDMIRGEMSKELNRRKGRSDGGSMKSKSERSFGHDFAELKDTKQV